MKQFWRHLLLGTLCTLIAFGVAACVNSKPKGGGRSETEVELPIRPVKRKPALKGVDPPLDTFDQHTFDWKALKDDLEEVSRQFDRSFFVETYGPFIIASNLGRTRLDEIKEQTIRTSYNAFYKDFFHERPRRVIKIYLFKDRINYQRYSKKLFNELPNTPYGYYRSAERVMLMNIATGTGTLVHELVHALIDTDFPTVPTWFNEGFASLFEYSRIEAGSISGMSNWRYPIFKRAIDTNSVVKLRQLVETTNDEFYNDRDGYNYAEARYLCFYLQDKGLLKAFYQRFKQTHRDDPSGRRTLEEILKKDIDEIEREWLQWANGLPIDRQRTS
ncbi:MAG: hypothetical protein AB1489_11860 [Acidobacteriota bacterium]